MKLISSTPPRHKTPPGLAQGWLRQRLRVRAVKVLFSKQTAWWVLVVIVAVFAYTIVHLFRRLIETMPIQ